VPSTGSTEWVARGWWALVPATETWSSG